MLQSVLLVATALTAHATQPGTFTNPVADRGADPWVIRHEGEYHYCFARRGAIWVSSSDSLVGVFTSEPVQAWKPEPGHDWSRELWAPELHYLDGAWYIYVAADDGNNDNHRMQVLRRRGGAAAAHPDPEGGPEGDSDGGPDSQGGPGPDGAFERVGELMLPDDKWAIDGTALEVDGQLYHVWSGWEGDTNVAQYLYICRMKDPATPEGPRAIISKPELEWELRGGHPLINEGPSAIEHDGRTFLSYAASGSWSDDYCLGLLELKRGADPMDPASWTKQQTPLLEGTDEAISPGHASFTTSPDGSEHWVVYHTARHPGAGWNRQVRIQRYSFDKATGRPVIGKPAKLGEALALPSGE